MVEPHERHHPGGAITILREGRVVAGAGEGGGGGWSWWALSTLGRRVAAPDRDSAVEMARRECEFLVDTPTIGGYSLTTQPNKERC